MKLQVKSTKGPDFTIEVSPQDTVSEVKKKIENTQGVNLYPAAQHMLIYYGKVLEEQTTLEENKIDGSSFIVIMSSKAKAESSTAATARKAPRKSVTPRKPAVTQTPLPVVTQATPTATEPVSVPSSTKVSDVASIVNAPSVNPPAQHPQATQPAAPATGPNAPLDHFDLHDIVANAPVGAAETLDYLHKSSQFQAYKAHAQANPQVFQAFELMLQVLQNPQAPPPVTQASLSAATQPVCVPPATLAPQTTVTSPATVVTDTPLPASTQPVSLPLPSDPRSITNASPENVDDQAPFNLVAGSSSKDICQRLVDSVGGYWDENEVASALKKANNDPLLALDDLYMNFPTPDEPPTAAKVSPLPSVQDPVASLPLVQVAQRCPPPVSTPPVSVPLPSDPGSIKNAARENVYDQAASNLVAGSSSKDNFQSFYKLVKGTWDENQVKCALKAADNDPVVAMNYLHVNFSKPWKQGTLRKKIVTNRETEAVVIPTAQPLQATQSTAAPATGPNVNPLDLIPQDRPDFDANAPDGAAGNLDFPRNSPQFQVDEHQADSNKPAEGGKDVLQDLGAGKQQIMKECLDDHHVNILKPCKLPPAARVSSVPRVQDFVPSLPFQQVVRKRRTPRFKVDPRTGAVVNPPAQPPQATQSTTAPATGPNANPLDLIPQDHPDVGAIAPDGVAGNLDFPRNSQQFQAHEHEADSNNEPAEGGEEAVGDLAAEMQKTTLTPKDIRPLKV